MTGQEKFPDAGERSVDAHAGRSPKNCRSNGLVSGDSEVEPDKHRAWRMCRQIRRAYRLARRRTLRYPPHRFHEAAFCAVGCRSVEDLA